ncbi:MAG: nucleoside recognition domain-containing protein [Flavobacteriia bacterium]|jgi:spore maturation protein SpmA
MVLNRVWMGMFIIAMIMGFSKLIFWQDVNILQTMMDALFDAAKTGFELALFMTGTIALWMGFMKIGEDGGAIRIMSKAISPLFSRLFPEVPKDHPAVGSIMMNFSANMLGLDNAATPAGLKAMKELQELNPNPKVATNAQIMFLVLNASGLTIIPVSILATRAANNSSDPTSVFLPILITTYFATLGGLIYVSIRQKINLFNKVMLGYVGTLTLAILGFIWYLQTHPDQIKTISSIVSNSIMFSFIAFFFILAIRSKIQLFDSFIEGAKEGFQVSINIIPYLVAMLAAVALFRSSGAFTDIMEGIKVSLQFIGLKSLEFIDALPVIFMKPFSGSGARALMVENMTLFGPDSFVSNLSATFQGSTETTFYVLAVYFGSVKVTQTRYAAGAGILCDVIGGTVAVLVSYLFFS